MSRLQKRRIWKHINLFNHGLWPQNSHTKYLDQFQSANLANEGADWSEADDKALMDWSEYYDVTFGDPWIYISWEMQRPVEDVAFRYWKTCTLTKYQSSQCELAVTKSCEPLMMNRSFKMDPPFVVLVPSRENYPLTDSGDRISEKFNKFRRSKLGNAV